MFTVTIHTDVLLQSLDSCSLLLAADTYYPELIARAVLVCEPSQLRDLRNQVRFYWCTFVSNIDV